MNCDVGGGSGGVGGGDCMTQSIYLPSGAKGGSSSSDDLEESFFFVESVGTGSGVGANSEPRVRALGDGVGRSGH